MLLSFGYLEQILRAGLNRDIDSDSGTHAQLSSESPKGAEGERSVVVQPFQASRPQCLSGPSLHEPTISSLPPDPHLPR